MKYVGIAIFLVGLALYGLSFKYEPKRVEYINFIVSNDCCDESKEINVTHSDIKYELEDYSFTTMQVGLIVITLFFKNKFILCSPKKKGTIHLLGVSIPALTIIADILQSSINKSRYIDSYWSGTGVPLPFIIIPENILLIVFIPIYIAALPAKSKLGISFLDFRIKPINYWNYSFLVLTLIFLILDIIYGEALMIIPCSFALYYLMSIHLSIQARINQINQS